MKLEPRKVQPWCLFHSSVQAEKDNPGTWYALIHTSEGAHLDWVIPRHHSVLVFSQSVTFLSLCLCHNHTPRSSDDPASYIREKTDATREEIPTSKPTHPAATEPIHLVLFSSHMGWGLTQLSLNLLFRSHPHNSWSHFSFSSAVHDPALARSTYPLSAEPA